MKIATHDSVTGEQGQGILSFLVTPFAKTLFKTIKELYVAGCRLFDIRVKEYKDGWYCAHGLWKSKKLAIEIFREINDFDEMCGVQITYEGKNNDKFLDFVHLIKDIYPNIAYGPVSIKFGKGTKGVKVKYENVEHSTLEYVALGYAVAGQEFKQLDGRSWHTYIPIPWIWKKIYHDNPEFNNEFYKFVDFL